MSREKTYSLLNPRFLFFSFIVFGLFFTVILCSIGTVKILSDFGSNIKISIVGILIFGLISYLIFFTVRIVYLYVGYAWHDRNTIVKINYQDEFLTLGKKPKSNIVNFKNLERIEFYLSTSNYRSLMRYFEYVKFITTDNKEYIVTSFVIDCSIIENLFENVKRTKKLSDIIYLK